jgi:hypothetical protein
VTSIQLLDLYNFRIEIFCENFQFVKKRNVKKVIKFSQNLTTFRFIERNADTTLNEFFRIWRQYWVFLGLRQNVNHYLYWRWHSFRAEFHLKKGSLKQLSFWNLTFAQNFRIFSTQFLIWSIIEGTFFNHVKKKV